MGHGICGPPAVGFRVVRTKTPTPPKEGGMGHPTERFFLTRAAWATRHKSSAYAFDEVAERAICLLDTLNALDGFITSHKFSEFSDKTCS